MRAALLPGVLVVALLAGCSKSEDGGPAPDDKGGSSGVAGAAGATSSGGTAGGGAGSGNGGTLAGGSGGGGAPGACGAIPTFEDGRSPTREVFLDANASGPGDGSSENPYAELDAALAELTPGTALRIRPGSYTGGAFASNLAGTETAPIWIGGVPGQARPVLEGGSNAMQLSSASYVVLHDIEVTGQDSNGINVDDGSDYPDGASHHLVFRGLLVHDIGNGGNQDCLKLSGVDDYFVLDSEFRGCSGGSAVDHVGCHRGVIARNKFVTLGGNGVQSKGGSADIEITQNRFLDAGERAVNIGGSTGFEFFRPVLSTSGENAEARDIRVVANLFRGGTSPVAFVGCVDCVAANNTIVDPLHWVVRILQETTSTAEYVFAPARNGRFVNNAVYFARADLSTFVNVGAGTDAATFEFSNNLWYAHDTPADSEPSPLPAPETAGIYAQDPAFADVASDDVAIGPASPLAGAGLTLVTADLDGACYRTPPSIGALEVP